MYNKFFKAQKNLIQTLNSPTQSFEGKNLYFEKISFWDFCEFFCEKLTKIGVNFYGFRLWENNSKKKRKKAKKKFKKAKSFCSKNKGKNRLN